MKAAGEALWGGGGGVGWRYGWRELAFMEYLNMIKQRRLCCIHVRVRSC